MKTVKIEVLLLLALGVTKTFGHSAPPRIAAPFFNDGENLSAKNCGIRNRSVSRIGWPFDALIKSVHFTHYGLIVSKWHVLTDNFNTLVEKLKGKELLVAHLGECRYYHVNRCGESTETGIIRQVLDVYTFDEIVHLWKIEKVPEFNDYYRPVCLFNKGNELDLLELEQNESHYRIWKSYDEREIFSTMEPIEKCLNEARKIQIKDQRLSQPGRFLCASIEQTYTPMLPNFLMSLHNGKYFLRGFRYNEYYNFGDERSSQSKRIYNLLMFFDLLPIIPWVGQSATGIAVLPQIPPQSPSISFKKANNLSFSSCGEKTNILMNKSHQVEDSSESDQIYATAFIVGGQTSLSNNHPWHAEINFRNHGNKAGFCGGTLISRRAVLTAAHCLYNSFDDTEREANDLEVTIGLHDVTLRNEPGIQTKTPRRLVVDQNYSHSAQNLENDIALLIFEGEGFTITNKVHPICLWNGNSDLDQIAEKPAVVVGWGYVGNFTQPNLLQEATLLIKSHRDCYLQDRFFMSKFLKPGKNFCAGYSNGTSACNGDSGGGLVIEKGGRWFIRGIVSSGRLQRIGFESVCNPNKLSLYTDISAYMNWIVENTPDIL